MGKTNKATGDVVVVKTSSGGKKKTQKKRRSHRTSSGIPTARALIKHLNKHPFDAPAIEAYKATLPAVRKATKLKLPELADPKELATFQHVRKEHKASYAAKSAQMKRNYKFLISKFTLVECVQSHREG